MHQLLFVAILPCRLCHVARLSHHNQCSIAIALVATKQFTWKQKLLQWSIVCGNCRYSHKMIFVAWDLIAMEHRYVAISSIIAIFAFSCNKMFHSNIIYCNNIIVLQYLHFIATKCFIAILATAITCVMAIIIDATMILVAISVIATISCVAFEDALHPTTAIGSSSLDIRILPLTLTVIDS